MIERVVKVTRSYPAKVRHRPKVQDKENWNGSRYVIFEDKTSMYFTAIFPDRSRVEPERYLILPEVRR